MRISSLLLLSLVAAVGCGEDRGSVYVDTSNAYRGLREQNHKLIEVLDGQKAGGIDVVWIIDNSGSMDPHQKNVIKNAELFMSEFIKSKTVSWRMGLVSTTYNEKPYIEFGSSRKLDHTTTNPVKVFKDAVATLGTSGSSSELVYYSLKKAFDQYPAFARKDASLAIIMVTDTFEQSNISNADLMKALKPYYGTDIYAYGAFAANDFTACPNENWDYKGSKYEQLIMSTKGKFFSLCVADFGQKLAEIGKDIIEKIVKPRVFLSSRPKPRTIEVYFDGQKLKPGLPENGGVWSYDFSSNSIVFHTLEFVPDLDAKAEVKISYLDDDGRD